MGYDDYEGFDFEDDDRGQRENGPKALRDALKAAKQRITELEESQKALSSQVAERNLKDVLEEKGLRPGLARVIKKDGVDASDPEAIDAWLNNPANQEDFAFSLDTGDDTPSTDGEDGSDPEEEIDPIAAEFRRMQDAAANALPEGKFHEASAAVEAAPADFKSVQAALDKALRGANS